MNTDHCRLSYKQTQSTLYVALLAMVSFPEVWKKIQTDVDKVVGQERLPTFADKDQLSYIENVIQETLRCVLDTFVHNSLLTIYANPDGTPYFPLLFLTARARTMYTKACSYRRDPLS
jgi:hypothetical protein